MLARLAADAVLVLHLAFIVFALFGGAATRWWRWMPLLHLPAAAWAVHVELAGLVCPLTPLENRLRIAAGEAGYGTSFVEHYLLAIVYPEGLTRTVQWALAAGVIVINLAIYGTLYRRWRTHRRTRGK